MLGFFKSKKVKKEESEDSDLVFLKSIEGAWLQYKEPHLYRQKISGYEYAPINIIPSKSSKKTKPLQNIETINAAYIRAKKIVPRGTNKETGYVIVEHLATVDVVSVKFVGKKSSLHLYENTLGKSNFKAYERVSDNKVITKLNCLAEKEEQKKRDVKVNIAKSVLQQDCK